MRRTTRIKKTFAVILTLIMAFGIAILVYAHCHNTLSCEHVVQDVCRGGYKWQNPNQNTVRFKVNPTWSGKPNLLNDAKEAAKKWYEVSWRSRHIAFRPTYDGTTTKRPGGSGTVPKPDTHIVVGYRGLGPGSAAPNGVCYRWFVSGSTWLMEEADIAINYYKNWRKHGVPLTGSYYCLRNTLTHEFGHLAGLRDV